MEEIAQALPDAELPGLEARRKGKYSLCRKIAADVSDGLPLDVAVDKVSDSVRYTFLFESGKYSSQTTSVRRMLESSGYEIQKFENTWGSRDYSGINSVRLDPRSGVIFEVQFHTPESFAAKTESHPLYEMTRLPGLSPEARAAAVAASRSISDKVKAPPGATDLG